MEAKQRLKIGAVLVEQRDSGTRTYDEMSGADQKILEDYETEKTTKKYAMSCENKPTSFSGAML